MAGGFKPGAGRPPGTVARFSADREETIRESGKSTPVEVILKRMWHHELEAERALAKKPASKCVTLEYERHMALACDAAKDAAPYVHARLSAIQHQGYIDNGTDASAANERVKSRIDKLGERLADGAVAGGIVGAVAAAGADENTQRPN